MTLIVSRRSLLALTAGSALAVVARAADPKPAGPDTDFLEYLGSSDDVEPELQQYLAKPDEKDQEDAKPAPKRGSGKT
ncbi:MAG TPA: hypothetical protein VMT92_08415 [Steroidobacteraceae bacterium]|nr:hypothetical protein [Steroidobacteraceae bacterium]